MFLGITNLFFAHTCHLTSDHYKEFPFVFSYHLHFEIFLVDNPTLPQNCDRWMNCVYSMMTGEKKELNHELDFVLLFRNIEFYYTGVIQVLLYLLGRGMMLLSILELICLDTYCLL